MRVDFIDLEHIYQRFFFLYILLSYAGSANSTIFILRLLAQRLCFVWMTSLCTMRPAKWHRSKYLNTLLKVLPLHMLSCDTISWGIRFRNIEAYWSGKWRGDISPSDSNFEACFHLARILEYVECPQYLRKYLFPVQKPLRNAGRYLKTATVFLYGLK